jgi:hypothetical protein
LHPSHIGSKIHRLAIKAVAQLTIAPEQLAASIFTNGFEPNGHVLRRAAMNDFPTSVY